ncbi:hypothetical protein A3A45_03445 [Candidatus Daviesbacteria bacterium RIFCSPLOWO2_01_FULL_36_8]|nr:MAG: hypothetical protein A3A45_03445 [Candidatus Daviesbacteria bacterium RIFCSPLOWO2_01_FULL_36_8]
MPPIKLTSRSQLKILSAVSSNFVVVWTVASFATKDFLTLTANLICAIVAWYIASKAEEFSGE